MHAVQGFEVNELLSPLVPGIEGFIFLPGFPVKTKALHARRTVEIPASRINCGFAFG